MAVRSSEFGASDDTRIDVTRSRMPVRQKRRAARSHATFRFEPAAMEKDMTTFSRFVPWLNRFALLATPALAKRTFKVKNEALMISRWFRAFLPTLVLD